MLSKWRYPSVLVLIAINLVPIFGVLFWNWGSSVTLLLYWSENLIIGFFNVVKMYFAKGSQVTNKMFFIFFFIFHYGLFCLAHGLFIYFISSGSFNTKTSIPFVVVGQYLKSNFSLLLVPFILMFISHGYSLINNYFLKDEYRVAIAQKLMTQPYSRVVITHFTIFLALFLSSFFGYNKASLVALVIIKSIFDVGFHLKERKKYSVGTVQNI